MIRFGMMAVFVRVIKLYMYSYVGMYEALERGACRVVAAPHACSRGLMPARFTRHAKAARAE